MGHLDDRELAQQAAQGNRAAWTQLIERHRRTIYAVAYKIVLNADDALDVVQNVYLRLLQSLSRYDGRGNFRNWLITITARLAIDHWRKNRKHAATVCEQELNSPDTSAYKYRDPNPREMLETQRQIEQIENAMHCLSPQQRAIFVLRFREDLSFGDIAEALQMKPGHARAQMARAMEKLNSQINKTLDEVER